MRLNKLVEKLAAFEPAGAPFLSLYLNAEANQHGRDQFDVWLKNEFREHGEDFEGDADEKQNFEAAVERINNFLDTEVEASANGICVFTNIGGEKEFFETAQLDAPFPENRLVIAARPHIFPLVRLIEQNPKFLVLWADTNKAAIYIFGGEDNVNLKTNGDAKVEEIQSVKTNRTQVGGWSQARYQRHVENFHLQHAKETVEEVEKLMREQTIENLILAGDETGVIPLLKEQFSKTTENSIVTTLHLSKYDSESEIRDEAREAMNIENATRDKEKVERMYGAAKAAAGMGVTGVEKTLEALSNGQVEELLISADFASLHYSPKKVKKVLKNYAPGEDNSSTEELPKVKENGQVADELLIRAMNSAAKIIFIEDESILKEANGVGAVLRYNINATANG